MREEDDREKYERWKEQQDRLAESVKLQLGPLIHDMLDQQEDDISTGRPAKAQRRWGIAGQA